MAIMAMTLISGVATAQIGSFTLMGNNSPVSVLTCNEVAGSPLNTCSGTLTIDAVTHTLPSTSDVGLQPSIYRWHWYVDLYEYRLTVYIDSASKQIAYLQRRNTVTGVITHTFFR